MKPIYRDSFRGAYQTEILPIHGQPGAGKAFTGAGMILLEAWRQV
jgi:hypothetical protein